ncbi:MAG: TIGR04076 family protein [Firmicutes bacterium]|nr:TIGR04076 family protein [Bacillota bacterium]MCL5040638.1 TIGR04076 family protein [Bacillota bacterium]
MYDLRIVVEEVRGFCDLPMQPGDYLEVKGGRIHIPAGKFFCLWALQSLMPMIPAKQRHIVEENDWLPHTDRMICPDPNGLVVFRFEQTPAGHLPPQSPSVPGQESSSQSSSSGPPEDSTRGVARQTQVPADRTFPPAAAPSSVPAGGKEQRPASSSTGQAGETGKASAKPSPDIPPRLLVNTAVCSGCRSCELACSFAHEESFDPTVARIQVKKDEPAGLDFPVACRQCGVASCVNACPEGALSRHPVTRAVRLDVSRCTGCLLCMKACPFEAIRPHPRTNLPLICDLCGGEPACVARCATGALRFGKAGENPPIGYRALTLKRFPG